MIRRGGGGFTPYGTGDALEVAATAAATARGGRHEKRNALLPAFSNEPERPWRHMDLEGFERMLQHAGLMGGLLDSEALRVIIQGVQRVEDPSRESDDDESNIHGSVSSFSSSSSPSEAGEDRSSECSGSFPPQSPAACTEFSFHEFVDALVALVFYKDPTPFVPFPTRFEEFVDKRLVGAVRDYWLEQSMRSGLGKRLQELIEDENMPRRRGGGMFGNFRNTRRIGHRTNDKHHHNDFRDAHDLP